MLDEALENLRIDRRMLERRGWLTRQELEKALAGLPDVSEKAAPQEEPAPESVGQSTRSEE